MKIKPFHAAHMDVDSTIFEACMALESGTVDPKISWSCAATENHARKYIVDTVIPNVGEIPVIFISGDRRTTNFRKLLYSDYKANRTGKPRPQHELEVQDFLVRKFGCWLASNQEADDLMGIIATENPDNFLGITGDGDQLMVPGNYLRPQKWNQRWARMPFKVDDPGIMYLENTYLAESGNLNHKGIFVTGLKCFYYKLLAGDTADNVKFLSGIGMKRAYDLLRNANSEQEMCDIVKKEYKRVYREDWEDTLTLAGRLLWVRREWNQMWSIPY